MKKHLPRVLPKSPSPAKSLPAIGDNHPDSLAVDRFAFAMKAKLAKKRSEGRGGWEDPEQCSAADLSYLLIQHCFKGDPVDVGNFAMMLQQRGERIVIDNETASMARAALKSNSNAQAE